VRLAWSTAVLACAAQTAAYLVNALVLDERFHQLNVASDGTVFAWANTLAIVSLAVLVVIAAGRGAAAASHAAVLALGFCLIALDDATGAHDRLRDLASDSPIVAAGGLGAFAVLLGVVFVLLWSESGKLSLGARTTMRIGLLTLAAAALGRVVGAPFANATFDQTVRACGVAVEQGLDFLGWMLVAAGYTLGLRERTRAQSSSPPPHGPAFTATAKENPRPASITAPTFPPGAVKMSRFNR